jgi:hypothetical protein
VPLEQSAAAASVMWGTSWMSFAMKHSLPQCARNLSSSTG